MKELHLQIRSKKKMSRGVDGQKKKMCRGVARKEEENSLPRRGRKKKMSRSVDRTRRSSTCAHIQKLEREREEKHAKLNNPN